MRRVLFLIGLSLLPFSLFGASKEIVELQRDLATLQDQVRTLQSGTTEKLTALTVLVQQTLDATNAANKAVAVLDSRMNERFEREVSRIGQPVAAVGSKVDQMSSDFAGMHDAMNDLVSRMGKLEQKLVEVNNNLRSMQAPPPAPGAPGGPTTGANTAPAIPPDTLYESAFRDRMGGKTDLALKEFSDYVQLYGDTDKAPAAQFWIGSILYDQNDFANAVKAFDEVLERYPTNNGKAPDAMYMKGQALVKLSKPTDGAKEFRSLLSKYPESPLAPKACTQLKGLGYNCSAAPAVKKKTTSTRSRG